MSAHVLLEELPLQLILPMWAQHEIDVFTDYQQRKLLKKLKAKKRIPIVVVPASTNRTLVLDLFPSSLLDGPFGPTEDKELSGLGDPYADDESCLDSSDDQGVNDWSDDAIAQLHEGMVTYSLRLLNSRGNGKEKKDLLRWMFDPDAMAVSRPRFEDGAPVMWKFIDPKSIPFSFELCCRFAGYDAERLREGLEPVLKNLGLGDLFKEIQDARESRRNCRVERHCDAGEYSQAELIGNV